MDNNHQRVDEFKQEIGEISIPTPEDAASGCG